MFQAASGEAPTALVDLAASQRHHAVLFLREAAYLPGNRQGAALTLTDWISSVTTQRPEVTKREASYLVTAAVGALAGPVAYGRIPMTAPNKALLARVMTAVAGTDLPRPTVTGADGATDGPEAPGLGRSRRETALGAAASLFRRHGYAGVGIDEIGVAVGITGSGIYRHFDSKEDLLVAAFRRTGDRLATEAVRAVSVAADAPRAVHDVVTSYVQVACTDPDLLFIYMHEARNLPASARREMSALQDDLYKAWEHALAGAYPDLPAVLARTVIATTLGVINAAVIAEPPDQSWVFSVGHEALRAAVAPAPA